MSYFDKLQDAVAISLKAVNDRIDEVWNALNDMSITIGTLSGNSFDVMPITKGGTGSNTKNFVDLTSSQDVGGTKTFTTNPVIKNKAPANNFQRIDLVKGANPSANSPVVMANVFDSENRNSANRIALLQATVKSTGETVSALYAYQYVHESTSAATLSVTCTADGVKYASAPTPPDANDNSTKIATTAWVNQKLNNSDAGGIDTGDFVFSHLSTKKGFLLCNGGAISRTTYSKLFSVIGTTYGSGDGSTTFNVPDLRGKFLQGANPTTGIKKVEAGLPEIEGVFDNMFRVYSPSGSGCFKDSKSNNGFTVNYTDDIRVGAHKLDFKASNSNSIYGNSNTVQPSAWQVYIHIKY